MDDQISINLNVFPPGEKTAELTCNWCGEIHKVEPEYRLETLTRGAARLAEMDLKGVTPEDTWTCGRCLLVLAGRSVDFMKTDCHEHEVQKERKPREAQNAE